MPSVPLNSAQLPDPLPATDDLQLVAAARGGDALARERLVAALSTLPAMLRGKNAKLGNLLDQHELEDAIQNALLAVWQKLDRFDGRGPLLHWAYGFGVVELRRGVERRGRRREQGEPPELTAPAANPDAHDLERVQQAVERLDDVDGKILAMKHGEGLTFDAIAERLATPANSVKTRYYRALERLRRQLGVATPPAEEA